MCGFDNGIFDRDCDCVCGLGARVWLNMIPLCWELMLCELIMLMIVSVCQAHVLLHMFSPCLDLTLGRLTMLMIVSVGQTHVVLNMCQFVNRFVTDIFEHNDDCSGVSDTCGGKHVFPLCVGFNNKMCVHDDDCLCVSNMCCARHVSVVFGSDTWTVGHVDGCLCVSGTCVVKREFHCVLIGYSDI